MELKEKVLINLKQLYRIFRKQENTAIKQWQQNLKTTQLNGKKVLVSVLRNGTWIEWGLYSGCVIRQKGYQPIFLYQKSEIEKFYGINSYFWKKAQQIPDSIFIDIDQFVDKAFNLDSNELPLYIIDAIAYDFHVEREDVLVGNEKYQKSIAKLMFESNAAAKALIYAVETYEIDRFFCYSGLIGITPTLLQKANERNLLTICLEGWAWKKGHVIYNFNRPALEYNILAWMNYYGWDKEKEETINEYLAFQDGTVNASDIKWLKGFYNVQQSKTGDPIDQNILDFTNKYKKSFLLAPNVIGDSSTLNRETIFKSQREWIKEIVEYFRNNKHISLIIRAHPAEVWVSNKVVLKLGDYAEKLAEGVENILVIRSEQKVNTFALIPSIKCGLIWLSSVGVDLVARNIPIICAASAKYDDIGIMNIPKTKAEYFTMLENIGKTISTSTSTNQKLAAKKYLYTVFRGFSFPAQGVNYSAQSLRLNKMPEQEEHDLFYSIILGEIPRPDSELTS
jgi:hypothetical protein